MQLCLHERQFLYAAGKFGFCVAGEFGYGGLLFGNAYLVNISDWVVFLDFFLDETALNRYNP
jgi:hypothetical protein